MSSAQVHTNGQDVAPDCDQDDYFSKWLDTADRLTEADFKNERLGYEKVAAVNELASVRQQLRDSQKGGEIHSVRYRQGSLTESILCRFRSASQVLSAGFPEVSYIVPKLIPLGSLVLLTGAAKGGGKTTFMTHLISAVINGRAFLGVKCKKTRVVYLTEQSEGSFFRGYLEPVGLEKSEDLLLLHGHQAAGISWPDLVDGAINACQEFGAEMLVVDTFMQFACLSGDQENSAAVIQQALKPLQHAAAKHGITIIIVHHDRKGGGEIHESGRGSSAFNGVVDLILNLRKPGGGYPSTVRELRSAGRYDTIPDTQMIELRNGIYEALGSQKDVVTQAARQVALRVAPTSADAAIDMDSMYAQAQTENDSIRRTTFKNAVGMLCSEGLLNQCGSGKKGDPYKFYIPDKSTPH